MGVFLPLCYDAPFNLTYHDVGLNSSKSSIYIALLRHCNASFSSWSSSCGPGLQLSRFVFDGCFAILRLILKLLRHRSNFIATCFFFIINENGHQTTVVGANIYIWLIVFVCCLPPCPFRDCIRAPNNHDCIPMLQSSPSAVDVFPFFLNLLLFLQLHEQLH